MELTRNADSDLLVAGIDHAARLDGILGPQCLDHLREVEPQGCELLGGELEVDFLVLDADRSILAVSGVVSSSLRMRSA